MHHFKVDELVEGFWYFTVLNLERRGGPDPAYTDIPLEAALCYGPLLLKQKHPLLLKQLSQTHLHLLKRVGRQDNEILRNKLGVVEQVLGLWPTPAP